MRQKLVSCIIPAYNEEKTIVGVINICSKTPGIGEIIVVNDGSEDQTAKKLKMIREPKLTIINLSKNRGKGYAIAQGIKRARYSILLFLDADLINLEPYHIFSLIQPVINNQVEMTIADLKANFSRPYSLIWPFSGQRCLKKRLVLPLLDEIAQAGYGMEVVLNERLKNKRIIVVPLINNKQEFYLKKTKKQKDWLTAYIKESWQVFQKMIEMKSYQYQKRAKEKFLDELARYLKTSIQKVKNYLQE